MFSIGPVLIFDYSMGVYKPVPWPFFGMVKFLILASCPVVVSNCAIWELILSKWCLYSSYRLLRQVILLSSRVLCMFKNSEWQLRIKEFLSCYSLFWRELDWSSFMLSYIALISLRYIFHIWIEFLQYQSFLSCSGLQSQGTLGESPR